MAALKKLAVDDYSGVFSPCPRQKMNHQNTKNNMRRVKPENGK